MAATLEEKKHRNEAVMITTGFAGLMILLMFLLKWSLPKYEPIAQETGIDVEITLRNLPKRPTKMAAVAVVTRRPWQVLLVLHRKQPQQPLKILTMIQTKTPLL